MDEENTTKIIKEKFDALPENIQEIILSSNYQDTLIKIGQQYNLNIEQMGILERETTMAMMGLTPLKDFETELTRELNIDKEKGSKIVADINEKVFLKIRDLLKLMNTPEGEEPSLDEEKEVEIPTQNKNIEMEKDTQTLSNAGIEIINKENNLPITTKPTPTPAVTPIPSILAQKLSTPTQTSIAKTEHSLPNITPPTSQNKPVTDPYREIPE